MSKKERSKFAPSKEVVDYAPYRGKAGEYLVMANLLMRNYNVALVAVDSGVDILAERQEKVFRVQVKSRKVGANSRTSFVLTEESLGRRPKPNYYVVAMMRGMEEIDYLIFSSRILSQWIGKGHLRHQARQSRYYAALIFKDERWFLKNLKNDVTKCVNNWDQIK